MFVVCIPAVAYLQLALSLRRRFTEIASYEARFDSDESATVIKCRSRRPDPCWDPVPHATAIELLTEIIQDTWPRESEHPEGGDIEMLVAHTLAADAKYRLATGEDGMLDDAVHESASRLASNVNNEGPEAQVRHLAIQVGVEEAGRIVDHAVKDEGHEPEAENL